MKYIKTINEYVKHKMLPRELRNKNLIYHATKIKFFDRLLRTNTLYGSEWYDSGVSTSRNKHYAYGSMENSEDGEWGYNAGDVQFIFDKDKLKTKYKVGAFDWEESKLKKSKVGEYSDFHQSEEKIMTDEIENFTDYVIGIHIVHNYLIDDLKENELLRNCVNDKNWIVFDEDWEDITEEFK
jgi:hypothetical protein